MGSPHHEAPVTLGYKPALDGLRAVAIAAVVLYHTGGLVPGGYLGVDLFFVLSGFLITTLLLDERAERGTVSLTSFYRRRAFRLLPALFCLLVFFVIVSLVRAVAKGDGLERDLFGVAAGIGYFSNLAMMSEPGTRAMPEELRHLWSLASEEQFYLLWPPILFLAFRVRTRLALGAVAALVALMTLRGLQLYLDGASWQRLGFGIDTRSVSILVGCLLALTLALPRRYRLPSSTWLEAVALSVVLGFVLVDWGRALFLGPLLAFGVCCAVLIVRALDEESLLAGLLSFGALVFLGRISYSLYLWHLPVFVALGVSRQEFEPVAVPALAIAVVLATASYYFVELPFLRRKRRSRPEADEAVAQPVPRSMKLAKSAA